MNTNEKKEINKVDAIRKGEHRDATRAVSPPELPPDTFFLFQGFCAFPQRLLLLSKLRIP